MSTSECIFVEMAFINRVKERPLSIGFELLDRDGSTIFWSYQTDLPEEQWPQVVEGQNLLRCCIPRALLNGGTYRNCPKGRRS